MAFWFKALLTTKGGFLQRCIQFSTPRNRQRHQKTFCLLEFSPVFDSQITRVPFPRHLGHVIF